MGSFVLAKNFEVSGVDKWEALWASEHNIPIKCVKCLGISVESEWGTDKGAGLWALGARRRINRPSAPAQRIPTAPTTPLRGVWCAAWPKMPGSGQLFPFTGTQGIPLESLLYRLCSVLYTSPQESINTQLRPLSARRGGCWGAGEAIHNEIGAFSTQRRIGIDVLAKIFQWISIWSELWSEIQF